MVDYYRGSGYDKKFVNAIKSGATRDELNDMAVSDMRKALEQASYVVPLGMSANALRLAYKGYKAGKTAIGLAKTGQRVSKAKTAANNAAKVAQTKADKAANMAAGSAVAGLVASSISNSGAKNKTKTTGTTKNTNTTTTIKKPTTNTKPKAAPSPSARSGNIGRTTTKYEGKARVAPKPQTKPQTKPKDDTKKKYGKSGMGMSAYQRLTSSKR